MSPAELAPITAFRRAIAIEELCEGVPTAVDLDGRNICVLRTESEVIAFEDRCPHRGHPLSEGSCVDGVLRCALHGWEFSIPEGDAVSPRAPFALEQFPTRVNDRVVEVAL